MKVQARTASSLVLLLSLLVGGCSGAGATRSVLASGSLAAGTATPAATSSPSPTGPVIDALGRPVSFTTPPTRIAIAGKASFMVADAVFMFPEASTRVVALPKANQGSRDFVSAIDPGYASKTILDGNAGPEAVAAVQPDVVILKSSSAQSLGTPLEAIGIRVVYVDFETPDEYTRDLATLGQLFGDAGRAQELIAYFTTLVGRVKSAVAAAAPASKPRVLLLDYSSKNGTTAFSVPPLDYIQTTEATLAGGEAVWQGAQLGSGWTTVNLEQIAAWNPDQVYVIAYFDKPGDVVAQISGDARWQALRAVQSKAVYAFPGDYYSWDEPDPRWALGLVWLAGHVNPGVSTKLDLAAEVKAFYDTAYGISGSDYDTLVKPLLPEELR